VAARTGSTEPGGGGQSLRKVDPLSKGGETMEKRLEKETLEKEALLWSKMKNALNRDEVRVCRK
jgi:hypothetical protein